MYLYRKYPQICPNTMTKSTQFFPFSLFLSLSLSFVFFSVFLTFFLPSYYIPWLFLPFPQSMREIGVGNPFFCFSCIFLNLSFLAVRLRIHCSGITSTLMRPGG